MILTIAYFLLSWLIGDVLPIYFGEVLTVVGLDFIIYKLTLGKKK